MGSESILLSQCLRTIPRLAMKAGAVDEGTGENGKPNHRIREEEIPITWLRKSVESVFKEPIGK